MNARQLYLIKLGEICLKGENRAYFEKKLKTNIKKKLKPLNPVFKIQKGRFFLETEGGAEADELVCKALETTPGLVGFSKSLKLPKEMEALKEAAVALMAHAFDTKHTFKVISRRSDKSFPLDSYEIACELGGVILDAYPNSSVNVKNPEITINVEIRDRAYMYSSASSHKGPSGLPVGVAGKGLLLLSGGIDSPVAGYRMAARGLRQDAIYFHTYPYTSDEALEKVKDLAKLISPYLNGTRLFVVNFTEAQLHINSHSNAEEHTLLMRYCMIKIANMVAKTVRAKTLVTGESLSQVASQTLESLTFTDSATEIPILRPLIGLDKEEIINTARAIGTYETSILPYEDCCTIFSPKHPLVRPNKELMLASYEKLKIEELLKEAAENCEKFEFSVR